MKNIRIEPRIPGKPHPVDIHVGGKVRQRRTLLGLSQERLGEAVGLTFQQIQKYERGANRIGSSRLYDLSRVLDVPISYFFEDFTEHHTASSNDYVEVNEGGDPMTKRETLELVRAYYRIQKPAVRKRFFELAKSLSAPNEE